MKPARKKLSAPQRKRRYARRRAVCVATVLVVAGGLVAADRLGLFGEFHAGDIPRYDNRQFRVVNVVDGDTLDVDEPDHRHDHTRIRLWGVDTPETVKPNTPPQHFGPEASAYTARLAAGKTVTLKLVTGDTRDKYDRLLAYVVLPDGRELNEVLIEQGYGYADPRFDHPKKREYAASQKRARNARHGLWANAREEDLPYYYRDKGLATASGN